MALTSLAGGMAVPFGIGQLFKGNSQPQINTVTLNGLNHAAIFIGQVIIDGGGSKTIDTSGSSAIHFRTGSVTFINGSSTFKVGIGAVDTANGPAGRAANSSNVITMDVSKSHTGGGGTLTNGWQANTPDAGTKTIANGDFVAMSFQFTGYGGSDTVQISGLAGVSNSQHLPGVSTYNGSVYAAATIVPDAIIIFSDGTRGWFYASDVASTVSTRTFNSGSATKEYGQLYNLPFPVRIAGIYGWIDPDADCDIILYSAPLSGSPVAEKTFSLDANTVSSANGRWFAEMFASYYDLPANTDIGTVFKPGGSNISAYYKTLNNAADRVVDNGGTGSYGISRASGAFANANSSLDHYFIGLLLGGFDNGAGGGGGGGIARLAGGGLVH